MAGTLDVVCVAKERIGKLEQYSCFKFDINGRFSVILKDVLIDIPLKERIMMFLSRAIVSEVGKAIDALDLPEEERSVQNN